MKRPSICPTLCPRRALPVALLACVALSACAEVALPDLLVPIGDGVEVGTDPLAERPVLGVVVTDPLNRMGE